MAVANEQDALNTQVLDGDGVLTVSFASTPTAGNILVAVGVARDWNTSATVPAYSDASLSSGANNWTLVAQATTGAGGHRGGLWWRVAGASEATTVTFDCGLATVDIGVQVFEFSHDFTTPVLSAAVSSFESTSSSTTVQPGSTGAAESAPVLWVGFGSIRSGAGSTITIDGTATEEGDWNANGRWVCEFGWLEAASTTAQNWTWTGSSSASRWAMLAGIVEGAAGSVTVTIPTAALPLAGVAPAITGSGATSLSIPTASAAVTGQAIALAGSGSAPLSVPTAALTVTPITPSVTATGAAPVTIPPAALTVAAVGPTVGGAGAASLAIPTTTLSIAGIAPTVTGAGAASVVVPSAALTVTGVVVVVTSGASLAIPTATLSLVGLAPTLTGAGAATVGIPPATLAVDGAPLALTGAGAASYAIPAAALVLAGRVVAVSAGVEALDFLASVIAVARSYGVASVERTAEVIAVARPYEVVDARRGA